MYEVIIRDHFSAAHQLRDVNGQCENLHGHNWKIEVVVASQKVNDLGIVIDFDIVTKYTKELVDVFDHRVLNDMPTFQDANPSAENIARYLFEELKLKVKDEPIRVKKITVWETDNCGASYSC